MPLLGYFDSGESVFSCLPLYLISLPLIFYSIPFHYTVFLLYTFYPATGRGKNNEKKKKKKAAPDSIATGKENLFLAAHCGSCALFAGGLLLEIGDNHGYPGDGRKAGRIVTFRIEWRRNE